ncbi:helix-turn-helix domain-containing protein [Anaerotruncus rubiinfantis]|uniref:helix-turn-helix domain-containing protein n=1 Tax=Anaerotruncus rubiinfantis TaxID=1720200 RepID=UPI003D79935B
MIPLSGVIILANRLKDLREDSDLLQREVAEAIGITTRKYSYIETGTQPLTEEILIKLAAFYRTSTDYILRLTDEREPNHVKRK